jgi:hypothetical protein
MKKNLKFSVIVNLNASGGKNLSLINEVIKLLKSDHEVKVFKFINTLIINLNYLDVYCFLEELYRYFFF